MEGDSRGKLFRKLRELGFISVRSRGAARSFEGTLQCKSVNIPVRLNITDWDFQKYPEIRLLSMPPSLPKLVPHIDATGVLCYFSPGSAVLDRYRPDIAVWQCIDKAQQEMDRLISDEAYREREFQNEFEANWAMGQNPLPWSVLLGNSSVKKSPIECFVIGSEGEYQFMASADRAEVESLCATRRWPTCKSLGLSCWILECSSKPSLPKTGFPSTVKEMFDWIKSWDPSTQKTIHEILGRSDYLKNNSAYFLISTSCGWFGFQLELDLAKRKGCLHRPTTYRQHLYGSGGARKITRLSVNNVSMDYIHSRNMMGQNLKDKRITLVGCGAIGGHLALALSKLGAGSGSKGVLRLIDPDSIQAENIGRHLLGLESLYEPKVEAVKRHLLSQFPMLNIDTQKRRVEDSDCAGDLIIDATGEESVGETINFYRLSLPLQARPAALHAWIVGNGECVQAIWCDNKKHACLHCLRQGDDARTKRFDPLLTKPEVRVRGCDAFTPYAISAPLMASALAIDLIIAWRANSLKLRFRTRAVEGTDIRQVKNQDVEPLSGCLACSGRS